jgi:hypothetical protein
MAYLTYYNLEIYDANTFPLPISKLTRHVEEGVLAASSFAVKKDITFDNFEGDCIQWYSCDDDMEKISKEMSNYVFVMYSDGKECEDNWKTVFFNGKSVSTPKECYYPAIDLSEIGLTDPNDYEPPEAKPIDEYFWNKVDG